MGLFGKSKEDLSWDSFNKKWHGYNWETMNLDQRYDYIMEQYDLVRISPANSPHCIVDLLRLIEILKTKIDALEKK